MSDSHKIRHDRSKRERLTGGLRVRILSILVVILLPILGVVYLIEEQEQRLLSLATRDRVRILTAHIVTDAQDSVRDVSRVLASLGRLPEIRATGQGCSNVLSWYRDTYPHYLNLGVIDRQGFLVCSALPSGRVNLGDRLYFRQAVATRRFSVGGYQIGRITKKPSLNFGFPILDASGEVQSVVFAALDLGSLIGAEIPEVLPPRSVALLVDYEGIVLARTPDLEGWSGRRVPDATLLNAIQSQRHDVIDHLDPDGIHRFYYMTQLTDFAGSGTVHVSLGIPTASATLRRQEQLTRNVAGLTLLGLIAAWLAFGLLVVKPIEALVAEAGRVGAGDLSARSGLAHGRGELGQLAHAFDGMAAQLERHEAERDAAEQKIVNQLQTLTTLYAGARQLTVSVDPDDLARRVVRIFVENFGGKVAWIARRLPDGSMRRIAHHPPDAFGPGEVEARWDKSAAEGQGVTGRAARSGFPVIVTDIAGDPSLGAWRELLLGDRVASLAAFPLISRDTTFGVIGVLSGNAGFFSAERVELFSAFAHQAAAALENARLHAETADRLEQLEALSKIDLAISSSLDLKITLGIILEQVTSRLRVDAADILVLRPRTQVLEFAAGRGFTDEARIANGRVRLGDEYAGRVALKRRIVSVPDLREPTSVAPAASAFAPERFLAYLVSRERFVSYVAAPLVAKGQVLGVLEVYQRAPLNPDQTWLAFLEAVAGQAAIAIDNATLFDNLQRSQVDLAHAYDTTLEGWMHALDLRDKETEGHTQRVTDLTMRLARAMGVPEEQVVHLRRGALLHDIGKIGIPDAILHKPDSLTDDEFARMRRHPEIARDLLQPIAYLRAAMTIPYMHHEKWDGTGYPQGLRGEQIPLEARIFAIVDVWDALTSDRPYRRAWSKAKALAYIREQSGRHFDPAVVSAFINMAEGELSASSG